MRGLGEERGCEGPFVYLKKPRYEMLSISNFPFFNRYLGIDLKKDLA